MTYHREHAIQPGQTYTTCNPRDRVRIRIIRIDSYTSGHCRAYVVDATTGKRPRWISIRTLYATAVRADGQPRRTGYALDTPED